MIDLPKLRRQIDAMVDYRATYKPTVVQPITVQASAEALHQALGYIVPRGPLPCPASCMYRGYRIQASG